MFKRIIWFSAGAAAGVAGLRRVEREIADRRARLAPEALVTSASDAANRGALRVRDALRDGRDEAQRVSEQLQATHDPARRRSRSSTRASAR